ncbi:MAG: MlrC domain protein [Actinomycetales bacterium]|nr:MlrC domain protein [Actinomycetales bacterium]
MRVGIGGVFQETNTYVTEWTGAGSVDRFVVTAHRDMIDAYQGSLTEIGGALAAASDLGVQAIPLTFAIATPGPTVSAGAYAELSGRLLGDIAASGPLDALVLVLHGAGVAQDIDSLELDLLRRVRATVGPAVPIVATLDLHSTLPSAAADLADLLLPYHHYPHTDMAERGREAMERAVNLAAERRTPITAIVHVPLIVTAGATAPGEPMAELLEACQRIEEAEGVIDASIQHGFPFSDVEEAGVHVGVSVDPAGPADAQALAAELAALVWERRDALVKNAVGAEEAVAEAIALARTAGTGRPVILSDSSDNPGGGAPGDGTHILRALMAANVSSALIAALTDGAAVAQAHAAGAGAMIDIDLGGRMGPLQGGPVACRAMVKAVTDGRWVATTPMGRGASYDMGPTALLGVDGIDLIVCTEPTQVFDPAVLAIHGVTATQYDIVVLKSSTHFRAGFEAVAGAIVTADAPGVTSLDLSAYPRQATARPPYPLDDHADWSPYDVAPVHHG